MQISSDTIVALSSGKGPAALAVLRISGEKAFDVVEPFLLPREKFLTALPYKIYIYFFSIPPNKTIDELTAIKYCPPKSYTGEKMVEIFCHGSEYGIREIIRAITGNGCRLSQKGEFTQRAFCNGKMDLLKAESIARLIESSSRNAHENAVSAYCGRSKKLFEGWRSALISIISELEASIEFPEEGDVIIRGRKHHFLLETFYKSISSEVQKRRLYKTIEGGITIPIIGISNAGKSSLFNMILGFDRSIVHHEKGTTRDAVSEDIIINDEKLKLIDTAGLNEETKNDVEILGITKAKEYLKNATVLLFVSPADQEFTFQEKTILEKCDPEKTIAIISKKDLGNSDIKRMHFQEKKIRCIDACLVKENDQKKIKEFIEYCLTPIISLTEPSIIINERQEEVVLRILKKIEEIVFKGKNEGEEIILYKLKSIEEDISAICGEITTDEVLEKIFSEFCIGK
jgi:tRNA modification GTPase